MQTKAIRVHKHGGPEALVLDTIDLAPPGAGEIQIEHDAIGLNYIDIYFRTGLYPAPSMPFVPGNEGAGRVTAIGEGVTGFSVGDTVGYISMLGGYAQARNLPAKSAVKLPAGVDTKMAAGMMLQGLTAEYLLFRTFKVQPGHTILVHAAAGGVGLILCQWAKSLGATVIGTVGTPEKAELAKANGCDHTILYRTEDFAARVKEITDGGLCDVVYDGVGKTTYPASLDCIKPFGLFASFGNASGAIENFNIGLLGPKGSLYATRPTLFTFIADRARYDEMAQRLFAAVLAGTVKVPISQTFALKDADKAQAALSGRETTGSMVLLP